MSYTPTKAKRGYITRQIINSNRRLHERRFDVKIGEWTNITSVQIIRDDTNGNPLPSDFMPSTVRAFRSKYERHTGTKQLSKSAKLTSPA